MRINKLVVGYFFLFRLSSTLFINKINKYAFGGRVMKTTYHFDRSSVVPVHFAVATARRHWRSPAILQIVSRDVHDKNLPQPQKFVWRQASRRHRIVSTTTIRPSPLLRHYCCCLYTTVEDHKRIRRDSAVASNLIGQTREIKFAKNARNARLTPANASLWTVRRALETITNAPPPFHPGRALRYKTEPQQPHTDQYHWLLMPLNPDSV